MDGTRNIRQEEEDREAIAAELEQMWKSKVVPVVTVVFVGYDPLDSGHKVFSQKYSEQLKCCTEHMCSI